MNATARIATLALVLLSPAFAAEVEFGRAVFENRREPLPARALDDATAARFELGHALYNTTWLVAGTPRAERRDGLGPLFIAPSCDACHNNGARGRAPFRAGEAPNSLVMQLSGDGATQYGHVLNTSAVQGFVPEATIQVDHAVRSGRYEDGSAWTVQEPLYRLTFNHGPLSADTVLRPRIGPALFGAGLLEAVPESEVERLRRAQSRSVRGRAPPGRFGWQAQVPSIRAQTELALSREMGLTTPAHPRDDCAPAAAACVAAAHGGEPEVSQEFLDAMVTFQRELAVPARGIAVSADALFLRAGCADCHSPKLESGTNGNAHDIQPFSDLLLHDLGDGLADRRVDGTVVPTLWRTAPLWGLKQAVERGELALLHDGRARSIEEAILWHGGQGAKARNAFVALSRPDRERLLAWVASL